MDGFDAAFRESAAIAHVLGPRPTVGAEAAGTTDHGHDEIAALKTPQNLVAQDHHIVTGRRIAIEAVVDLCVGASDSHLENLDEDLPVSRLGAGNFNDARARGAGWPLLS